MYLQRVGVPQKLGRTLDAPRAQIGDNLQPPLIVVDKSWVVRNLHPELSTGSRGAAAPQGLLVQIAPGVAGFATLDYNGRLRGCPGFDVGSELARCMSSLSDARKSPFKKLTANDERFALAA